MNRIEEPYFNKPNTISVNKPGFSDSMLSSSDASSSSTNNIPITINAQSILILLLFFFLIISVLGINILNILGNFIQSIADIFGPLISRFLNALGYSAGTALDKVSDVTADAAKVGIDIADGALNDIGGLLKGSGPRSKPEPEPEPEPENDPNKNTSIPLPTEPPKEPSPDSSENAIQKPITSDKWNWCLVGEYQNKRGCIEITDTDKCMSGQVFPSQKMCLNPTWTPNA